MAVRDYNGISWDTEHERRRRNEERKRRREEIKSSIAYAILMEGYVGTPGARAFVLRLIRDKLGHRVTTAAPTYLTPPEVIYCHRRADELFERHREEWNA